MQQIVQSPAGRVGVTVSEPRMGDDNSPASPQVAFVRVRWDDTGGEADYLTADLRFLGPADEVRAMEGESLEAIIARANARKVA